MSLCVGSQTAYVLLSAGPPYALSKIAASLMGFGQLGQMQTVLRGRFSAMERPLSECQNTVARSDNSATRQLRARSDGDVLGAVMEDKVLRLRGEGRERRWRIDACRRNTNRRET